MKNQKTGASSLQRPSNCIRFRISLALASLVIAGSSYAQTGPINLDIPAQSLDKALNALAHQSGARIVFSTDLTEKRSATAINGKLTVKEALVRLLSGSGLAIKPLGESGYTVVTPGNAGVDGGALPLIQVTGQEEDAWGRVEGYVAKRSATGTKTDTPIIEIPQSISVVGSDEIQVRKAQNLTDALGYTAGVAAGTFVERTGDAVFLRGFTSSVTYRDGSKFQVNRFDGQQETYGLERIEVIKGASSVISGTAEPGGVVNTVSKRPTSQALREINVEYGSFNRKQISGDFGGALSDDGVWSYRLTALKRHSDTYVDYVPDNRTYIAPALKWQPDASTSLTFLSEYQHDRTAYAGDGLPLVGTVLPNPNGQLPRNLFVGEPGYDKYDLKRSSIGYLFEHAFNDKLKLRHSLRSSRMELDWSAMSINLDLAADQRTTTWRGGEDRDDQSSILSTDTSLQYDWNTANVAHTTLAGFDYRTQKYDTGRYDRAAGPLDLFAPVYGSPLGGRVPYQGYKNRTKQLGIYIQDQMKIADKWVVLLGGRKDWVEIGERDFFTNAVRVDDEKSDAFTGRAGLVYLADNGLAPFASFSQSFEPTSGQDRLGNRFKPTTGQQYEIGVRFQPKGADTLISAAVYELTRQNVLVNDPVAPSSQAQLGEVRSKGIELEAKTNIGRNANLIAAYTYTDARTIKSSPVTPDNEGRRSGGVPRNQFSLWGDYNFGLFGMPGLKIGAGARYVGSTSSDFHDIEAPSFTVFDAMASYVTGPYRFSLNMTNLTDKTYFNSCPYRCYFGEPRKVIATASYRW